jgi:hypothetical protein
MASEPRRRSRSAKSNGVLPKANRLSKSFQSRMPRRVQYFLARAYGIGSSGLSVGRTC